MCRSHLSLVDLARREVGKELATWHMVIPVPLSHIVRLTDKRLGRDLKNGGLGKFGEEYAR